MVIKSAKNICNVNQTTEKYEVDNIIFPSKLVYSILKRINRNLRLLYSKDPNNELWPRINYSMVRDNESSISMVLERVEERLNRIDEKDDIIITGDAVFFKLFPGIIDFLYEASEIKDGIEDEYTRKMADYNKKRITYLADKMWELGIHPSEL